MMISKADEKRIELLVEYSNTVPRHFVGDGGRIRQVLTNLVGNALKFTERGEVLVHVGYDAAAGQPGRVRISVEDTGIGIPAEDLPRLFERFYRVDKARSRELGGTGLGLAIVKHLVRAQGGTVRVESEPNQGSTFWFTLPVHDLGLLEDGTVQPELTLL